MYVSTGVTALCPVGASGFTPGFMWVNVAQSSVFCTVLWRPWLSLCHLSIWSLYYLSLCGVWHDYLLCIFKRPCSWLHQYIVILVSSLPNTSTRVHFFKVIVTCILIITICLIVLSSQSNAYDLLDIVMFENLQFPNKTNVSLSRF